MENLGFDIKLLIAQVINFTLFFLIIKKMVAKPFMEFLREKEREEKGKLKLEDTIKREKENWEKEYKRRKEKLEDEIEKILKETREEAIEMKNAILQQAKDDSKEIISNARKEIEEERKTAEKMVEGKALKLSLQVVENGLKNYLTISAKKDLTKHILKNMEEIKRIN